MKTIDEMTEVMQAFKRGEEIESIYYDSKKDTWTKTESPTWNWTICDYRIKPKEPEKLWFWRIQDNDKRWLTTDYMYTEIKIREQFPRALVFERMDMLGSKDVEC